MKTLKGYTFKSVEYKNITPKFAEHLFSECYFDRQRKLKKVPLMRLTTAVSNEEFFPSNPIILAEVGKKKYLINGYHTIEAVHQSGVSVWCVFLTVSFPTFSAMTSAYCKIDIGTGRTAKDASKALGMDGILKFNERESTLVYQALRWIVGKVDRVECQFVTSSQIMEEFSKRESTIKKYHSLVVDNTNADRITRSIALSVSVQPVALMTIQKDPGFALPFWKKVCMNTLPKTDPARKIVEWLREWKEKKIKLPTEHKIATVAWLYLLAKEGKDLSTVQFKTQEGGVNSRVLNTLPGYSS